MTKPQLNFDALAPWMHRPRRSTCGSRGAASSPTPDRSEVKGFSAEGPVLCLKGLGRLCGFKASEGFAKMSRCNGSFQVGYVLDSRVQVQELGLRGSLHNVLLPLALNVCHVPVTAAMCGFPGHALIQNLRVKRRNLGVQTVGFREPGLIVGVS